MEPIRITDVPSQVRTRLRPDEAVRHVTSGSCSGQEQWVVLTDQRLLFGGARPSGAERDGGRVLESGSIPLHELSRSVLSTAEEGKAPHDHGVNVIVTAHGLRIFLPVPSREEAVRLQRVLAELLP